MSSLRANMNYLTLECRFAKPLFKSVFQKKKIIFSINILYRLRILAEKLILNLKIPVNDVKRTKQIDYVVNLW